MFVPLMTGDAPFGVWLQGFFGSGETAAYGLFFALAGLSVVVMSGVAWMIGPIRHVERDVPDAVRLQTNEDSVSETAPA
ncbi:MAG: hypothetical protein V3S28_08335 [Acidimicrobiia bacterium]